MPTSRSDNNMNRTESHWLAIGSIVATGLVSVILGIVTLQGFRSSASGDLVISPTMVSWISLAMVLVGTLVLLRLELEHVTSRRTSDARWTRVSAPARA
jgi:hypothetical protein